MLTAFTTKWPSLLLKTIAELLGKHLNSIRVLVKGLARLSPTVEITHRTFAAVLTLKSSHQGLTSLL